MNGSLETVEPGCRFGMYTAPGCRPDVSAAQGFRSGCKPDVNCVLRASAIVHTGSRTSQQREKQPMAEDTKERLLVRIPEAAERLGLSRSTVYEFIADGDLRPIKIGRAVRIPVSELVAWVARHSGADDSRSANG